MNWQKFKDEVDRQIKEKGIDNTEIWYIDFDGGEEVIVYSGENDIGIAIS